MKKIIIPVLLILASCSLFIEKIDKGTATKEGKEKKFDILFSHNLSGETHPCGCRNFPLGGLPQVAGVMAEISKDSEILYVDTGDTFFPSSVVPITMKDSLSFAANNLALGLEKLGLKYFVPGDQDFAMGLPFLQSIANSRSFEFLIANLGDPTLLKHKKYAIIEREKTKIFLVGLVDPETFNGPHAQYFIAPKLAFPSIMEEIKRAGYKPNNKYHRLIVLSHAGIDPDRELAKKHPYIDWIIGAHSQNFLRYSDDVGNVKIVQTLSKNHYLGDIKIDLNSKKETDTYELIEVRDELEKKLIPNPMTSFIIDHKNKMNDLQIKEQASMGMLDFVATEIHKDVKKYPTAQSCIECHKPQTDFWQKTPHSIAYTTLINANEANNLSCIGCHSLGLNETKGYNFASNITDVSKRNFKPYWDEAKKIGAHIESVREAKPEVIQKASVEWFKLDKKMDVKQNFANVQCLNCHGIDESHPAMMSDSSPKITPVDKVTNIKNKCLSCHTSDQSPEWYASGLKVNHKFEEAYKKVSCPSISK